MAGWILGGAAGLIAAMSLVVYFLGSSGKSE